MKPWEYRKLTAFEVFEYATARAKSRWDHDAQIAYINAHLSLYGTLFDGKKFPSIDKFLSENKNKKKFTEKDWKALILAVEANYGSAVSEKEANRLRKENLRALRERNAIGSRKSHR